MNYDLNKIVPENYQRAFFFERLGYLLMDYVLFHYRKRNFLTIYNNEMLGTYIENSAADKTLENGKEIFSNKKNFDIFEAGFRKVIAECDMYIAKTKKVEIVTLDDFFDLRAIIQKLYYYFEKTEFFFTDACYHEKMNNITKKNLLILGGDLKMKSRPQLFELLTTVLYNFAELIAKQHNINVEDVKFYSFAEVVSLMEASNIMDPLIIAERKKSYIVYCEDEHIIPLEGKQKEIVLKRFTEPNYASITEFKGIIANKGKVIAKARVILPEADIPYDKFVKKLYNMKMNKGEILVTETTSPDFVPLMKKAGGIIANQGGMNSHAAIMSRELGVPCLVGTFHATHILATGDLIELDADTGIVKIIEKGN
jgi:phosphoenolpyruvate synthase/pyruvate phosphate dikinase